MECPQQTNFDDCGIFAMMFASKLGMSRDLHLIKAEAMQNYRLYIALCIIKDQLPGLLCAGVRVDQAPEASDPSGECLN